MNVSPINNNNYNKPNFGMALKIKPMNQKLGNNVAKIVENTRTEIEKLAEDVDIVLRPERNIPFGNYSVIGIIVKEKNISILDKIKYVLGLRPKYKNSGFVLSSPHFCTESNIIKETKRTKEELRYYNS